MQPQDPSQAPLPDGSTPSQMPPQAADQFGGQTPVAPVAPQAYSAPAPVNQQPPVAPQPTADYATGATPVAQPLQPTMPAQISPSPEQPASPQDYATYAQPNVAPDYQTPTIPNETYQATVDPTMYDTPAQANQTIDTSQLFRTDPSVTAATPLSEPTPQSSSKRKLLLSSVVILFVLLVGAFGIFKLMGGDQSQQNQQAAVNEEAVVDGLGGESSTEFDTATGQTEQGSTSTTDANNSADNNNSSSETTSGTTSTGSSTDSSGSTSSSNSSPKKSTTSSSSRKKTAKKTSSGAASYSVSCSVVSAQQSKVSGAVLSQTAASIKAAYNGSLGSMTAWVPASLASAKIPTGPVESGFKSLKPKSCLIDLALLADSGGSAMTVRATFSSNSKGTPYQSMFTLKKQGSTWKTVSVTVPTKG